jgi:hypothetical protein
MEVAEAMAAMPHSVAEGAVTVLWRREKVAKDFLRKNSTILVPRSDKSDRSISGLQVL